MPPVAATARASSASPRSHITSPRRREPDRRGGVASGDVAPLARPAWSPRRGGSPPAPGPRGGGGSSALPVLEVLRGPLGAVLAAARRRRGPRGAGDDRLAPLLGRRVAPLLLFVAGFPLLGRTGYHYTGRHPGLGRRAALPADGTEPLAGRGPRAAGQQGPRRDGGVRSRRRRAPLGGAPADGRPFPAHSVGLPALLAPVYALGGRRACVLFLAALGAVLALVARALALRATGDAAAATLAWVAALGPPAAFYSFHVYTELPSALALGGAFLLLLRSSRSVAGAVAAAVLASTLPWLHVKLIPAAAALGVRRPRPPRGARSRGVRLDGGAAAVGYLTFFFGVRKTHAPRGLRRRRPRRDAGAPAARRGGTSRRPLVRAPAVRPGLCPVARGRPPRRAPISARGLAGRAGHGRGAGAGPHLADVVGGAVPARALPRPPGPLARGAPGPARGP